MQIDHRTPMGHTDVPENFNVAAHFLDGADGDRTALIGGDGRRTSYARLRGLANRVGHALRALGVRPQDRVLIAMSDGVEFVAAWYGAQKIGAVTAEVYSFLHAKEYRYYERYVAPAGGRGRRGHGGAAAGRGSPEPAGRRGAGGCAARR
ncbi:hypothetical protein GCM10020254_86160 [Streptomyces goshikiensis]